MTCEPPSPSDAIVSVVIPCFNQARYVGAAIESALTTIRAPHEVIVVDDGSTDESWSIIEGYGCVLALRQQNGGVTRARNAGLALASGDFVLFLDADDWLLDGGVDRSVEQLQASPDCMWVAGRYVRVADDGSPLETSAPLPQPDDAYAELLKLTRFAIGSPASVLFRRVVFDEVGRWSDNFEAGADYELYLRIARRFPICTHARPVAVYRRHSEEMSRSPERMLREIALVWRAQRPHLHQRAGLRAAYDEGCRHWIGYYGRRTLAALLADLREGRLRNAAKRATVLASVAPRFVASTTAVRARSSRTRY